MKYRMINLKIKKKWFKQGIGCALKQIEFHIENCNTLDVIEYSIKIQQSLQFRA